MNLLPVQEKKELRRNEMLRLIQLFSAGCIVIFLVGIVFLLPIYLPLWFEQREIVKTLLIQEEASRRARIGETSGTIRSLRSTLRTVRAGIGGKTSYASGLLEEIFTKAGPKISFQAFSIRGIAVTLSGVASTRRSLLDFEERLRSSGHFDNISVPLSHIVRDVDISFTLQGKLKEEYRLPE
jgi:Tfp pilus assembly protein PilN